MWKTILTARLLIAYYTSKTKARDLRNFYITERSHLTNKPLPPAEAGTPLKSPDYAD